MISWPFVYSNLTTEPPTGNQLRFDAGPPFTAVTKLWVRDVTSDGLDVHRALLAQVPGTAIYVQDKNDHAQAVLLDILTAPIVAKSGYVEIPVRCTSAEGALNNNQAVEAFFAEPEAGIPASPAPAVPGFSRVTLPPLWTVEQAKTHLRITSTAHDADLQQKVTTAQEAILSYLGGFADPMWSAATAPAAVTHAMHLLTAFYYEDRGDGEQPDPWPKIYALLAAYRDPTVA